MSGLKNFCSCKRPAPYAAKAGKGYLCYVCRKYVIGSKEDLDNHRVRIFNAVNAAVIRHAPKWARKGVAL